MPQQRVITERVGFSVPAVVLAQADILFGARNEYRSEMVLRIIRAYNAGKWQPRIQDPLPSEGEARKVQLRLRPQDLDPYRAKCKREDLPISTPVAHGLWIYARTPDPADLPF